ncbi:phosphoglucosamine mutase [Akkermansiaceae bacterium]|nr:phosphoglucosamine mutase [Akkermansiaceae bacterium]
MSRLFGTDGIRGRYGEHPVNGETACRLGGAVVEVCRGLAPKVLIGRDTRASGVELERCLVDGLVGAGAQAVRLGVVPSPALAYLVQEMQADAAVMLTASHNPFEDNGMKVFGADGFKLPDAMESALEALLLSGGPRKTSPSPGKAVHFPEAMTRYAESLMAAVRGLDLTGMKVVVDAGNGAGFAVGPRVFRELGAEVIEIGCDPDGRNINEGCGSLYGEAAARAVREHGADLGISLDGDADRLTLSAADGQVVSGDRVMAICALGLKAEGKLRRDAMVATVMSNLGLDEAMRKQGISVLRAAVGDRHVLEMMRAEGLCFGGENSGHLIFSDHSTTGDGIMSALQICRMMKRSGKTLAQLAGVMGEYPSKLLNLPVREKPGMDSLEKLQAMIAEADVSFGKAGRQLIRYSGTENKIRILVEHKDAAEVDSWIGKFKQVIAEEIG